MSNLEVLSILVGEMAAQALCLAYPSLSELAQATDEEITQHARVSARRARQARLHWHLHAASAVRLTEKNPSSIHLNRSQDCCVRESCLSVEISRSFC